MDRKENLCDTFHTKQIPIFRLTSISPFPYPPLDLSNDAKVLYVLLLDRAGISRKKGYIEAGGTFCLYFTVEDVKAKLRRSRQVATRAFHELESCGLILRRKQGLGRPAVITLNLPVNERRGANDR